MSSFAVETVVFIPFTYFIISTLYISFFLIPIMVSTIFILLISTLLFSLLLALLSYYFSTIFLLTFFCLWDIQQKLRRYSYDPQQVRATSLICFIPSVMNQIFMILWFLFILLLYLFIRSISFLFYDSFILLWWFSFASVVTLLVDSLLFSSVFNYQSCPPTSNLFFSQSILLHPPPLSTLPIAYCL